MNKELDDIVQQDRDTHKELARKEEAVKKSLYYG